MNEETSEETEPEPWQPVAVIKGEQIAGLKRVASAGKCPVCGRQPKP